MHVPFHGMGAQGMGKHDVVDIVARAGYSLVKLAQPAGGGGEGKGCDPRLGSPGRLECALSRRS